MQPLKVDRTKIRTVANYAKLKGITPTRVYQLAKEGKIKMIELDGVKFIELK